MKTPAPSPFPPGQGYGPRIDAVIYHAEATRDFTREEWLLLAAAALDQGVKGEDGIFGRRAIEAVHELCLPVEDVG
ncbi:MAG TPA: hypothetical protein VGI39_01305 [Polyangiaceae bacterium]